MENQAATTVVENPYGLGALWAQGDFVAKGTLIIMVIMSLATWYILVMKLLDQRKLMGSAKLASQKFWSAGSLREAVDKMPKDDTYRSIAEDGVDCISIGGLTKHVQAIDLSLKLGPPPA